jgi:hypothetical protein
MFAFAPKSKAHAGTEKSFRVHINFIRIAFRAWHMPSDPHEWVPFRINEIEFSWSQCFIMTSHQR